ncbi:MAG TPA: lyase family protein, partial [Polyangiaceae bacterium]|nr:lyase family protein [Polyangiaceae bacterium]
GFTTPTLREVFSSSARVRRWCDAETALAHATAEAGLIPAASARAIESACLGLTIEPGPLLEQGWAAGTPILVLLDRLRASLPSSVAPHLHFGATSQDILDTGTMLQVRDGFAELSRLLEDTADALAASIRRHPRDWVMARTLLQPALPTRFAWRVACWLDPVLELLDGVERAAQGLPVQLGGPVGDLAAFGDSGAAVVASFAKELGLSVPSMPWHTDRRPVAESVFIADRAAGAAEKVSADLLLLSQKDVAEMRVPTAGSSSMGHKQNAISAVRAVAAARACHGVSGIILQAQAHELERAAGSWQSEWFALPLVFQTAGAALAAARDVVAGMELDVRRAAENLDGADLPEASPADAMVVQVMERHRRRRGERP